MTERAPLHIGSIRCVVDVDTTRRIYSRLIQGGAERCGCLPCRNFAAARALAFPPALRSALESVGIDWRKESEAVHYGRLNDSGHLYDIWVNFVGSVENGAPVEIAPASGDGPAIRLSGFNDAEAYTPKPAVFDGHVVGRIELQATLPWVLTEAEPR